MKTFNYLKRFVALSVVLMIFATTNIAAQDGPSMNTNRGNGWTEQGDPLVLNLNFQNYTHFHSQPDANSGNSRNSLDPEKDIEDPESLIPGFLDFSEEVNFIGSDLTATLDFYQCAFAPEWMSAYGFRDEDGSNTENVSNGFVEISRDFAHGGVPNIQGYFTIDLSNMEYIATLQYTTSSAGGDRRGMSLEYTLDGGDSWDTLRWQPGDNRWAESFTASAYTNERTSNGYRGDGSAYGLVWEDALYFQPEDNDHFMVRFTIAANQVHRVHDFKVYGDLKDVSNSLNYKEFNALSLFKSGNEVKISEYAAVSIYNLAGTLVKSGTNVNAISISDLPSGIYLVKAESGTKSNVVKIVK